MLRWDDGIWLILVISGLREAGMVGGDSVSGW